MDISTQENPFILMECLFLPCLLTVQTCCTGVDFLFKVDDDMFVQMDKLLQLLEKQEKGAR